MRRSIVLKGRSRTDYASDPVTPLPPGAMRIAPLFAGICGTDLDIVRRARADVPSVLGHEVVARVTETEDAGLRGRHVSINPVSSVDQTRNFGHSIPGIWTTQRIVTRRETDEGHVALWPTDEIGPEHALAEPVAAAVYAAALMRLHDAPARDVLILGSGAIAMILALVLIEGGHAVTVAAGDTAHANELATRFCDVRRLRIAPRAEIAGTDERFAACVVAVSRGGCREAIRLALRMLAPGGILDLVSSVAPGQTLACAVSRFDDLARVRWENSCGVPPEGHRLCGRGPNGAYAAVGQRGVSALHLATAMTLIEAHRERIGRIVSHVVPFEDAAPVVEALARDRATRLDGRSVTKVVIAFER